MVKIFIIYGKLEGEKYGSKIDQYFKKNKLDSFLASPTSPDIKPGEDFQKRIDLELDQSDVVIVIVTRGLGQSVAALDEITRTISMGIPIIPYVKNNTKPPPELQTSQLVTFKKINVATKLKMMELEIEMWRLLDYKKKLIKTMPQNELNSPILSKLIPMGVTI